MQMKIKHIFISFVAAVFFPLAVTAQMGKDIGLVCLNPYIPENEELEVQASSMLTSKLQQIATANGMSGAGFDNRFIITAHVQKLQVSQTQTFPQKTTVHLNVGIYVGDGLDGTLYSSYACEVKGIGNNEDQAVAAAIRKVNPMQQDLQEAIVKGKKMILEYYDKMSGNIIQTAKTTAAAGRYEDAINMLFAIPMNNKDFQTAQSLIAQYGSTSLNNKNMEVVRNARSTWSANPTEDGALEAKKTLEDLNAPSAKVMTEVKKLQEEIAARLKAVSDREFRLEAKKVQNEKELEIATVNAVASVAKAYVANQPRVVYHCHWW